MEDGSPSPFSGAVKLGGLDDFIAPSQECIKPVEVLKRKRDKAEAARSIQLEVDGTYIEVADNGERQRLETTKIDLNDCLACSGCITSAESILVAQQSAAEFWTRLGALEEGQVCVVSLADQARASLAQAAALSQTQTHDRLAAVLHGWGVHHVVDVSVARQLARREARQEFVQSVQRQLTPAVSDAAAPKPSARMKPVDPLLNSSCPGWICYAEKTHGDHVLPFISRVKSPQQIQGTLVKRYWAQQLCISPADVYHVAVMPCYDKKLEASRDDFYNDVMRTRDVDTVITASELATMLEEKGITLATTQSREQWTSLEKSLTLRDSETNALLPSYGSSGGYAEDVFRHAAKVIWGVDVALPVVWEVGRNPDMRTAVLRVDGREVLKVAIAYGFRNIQNVVRQVKGKRCRLHYVEVMACPAGCLNGGGQVPSGTKTPKEMRQHVAKLDAVYHEGTATGAQEEAVEAVVQHWYSACIGGEPGSAEAQEWLHTQYHAVEKLSSNLSIKW